MVEWCVIQWSADCYQICFRRRQVHSNGRAESGRRQGTAVAESAVKRAPLVTRSLWRSPSCPCFGSSIVAGKKSLPCPESLVLIRPTGHRPAWSRWCTSTSPSRRCPCRAPRPSSPQVSACVLHFRVKVTHLNFPIAEKSAQEKAERNEKYAALAARKEALERQVREKNEDLKRLCVQEAELSGTLPLETPLEPGELPPTFRRRMGTAFTIPDNLFLDNLKSHEVSQRHRDWQINTLCTYLQVMQQVFRKWN